MKAGGFVERLADLAGAAYDRIPRAYRPGGAAYRRTSRFLRESRGWDRERMEAWQLARLRDLVRRAAGETVYYRELFRKIGFEPGDLKSFDDFRRLPLLTREAARANLEGLVSNRYPKERLILSTSGGTTGTPFGVYSVKRHYAAVENAFVHDIWRNFGFREGPRHAIFRGIQLKDGVLETRRGHLYLSSYHFDEETVEVYVDAIRRYGPAYLQAYPSSIASLCLLMKERGFPPFPSLELVMCSSENLYPSQKALIEEFLGVPVCNLYGNTEHTVIAGNARECGKLHVYPQYGFTEILAGNGEECGPGETGGVVSTGFTNPAFFLLRYETCDLARSGAWGCGCGWRHGTIERIEGREQEFLVSSTGRKVPGLMLNWLFDPPLSIFDKAILVQFEQSRPGEVLFRFVPKENCSDGDGAVFESRARKVLGEGFDVKAVAVREIPRTGRGKHSMIRQRMGTAP